jgi:hydrogenase maturation factor
VPGTDVRQASAEEPFEPLARAALTLARRVAAGGTLFSAAPAWPWHAQHVAVEFVHPVVVGARAVDAVAVPAEDPVGWLRPLARRGDALVLVADGADRTARRLAARAALWGVTSIWLAVGEPPPVGAAHHVVHLHPDPAASFSGRAVLGYHLLWELSQLCFEHPGLLAPGSSTDIAETACVGDHCVTCSDEGRLGEVLAVAGTTARCATEQGEEAVDVGLLGPLVLGDLVLIHAGVALQVVPEEALLLEESVLAGELPR